jgi:uncharacterized protein (TIGR03437 family)
LASAQTPANVTVLAGNGQLLCTGCVSPSGLPFQFPDPFKVKVTDTNGNPVANSPVTWTKTAGFGSIANPTTYTDGNGVAQNTVIPSQQVGTGFQPFLQSTIVAQAGSASATFTLSQGLVDLTSSAKYVGVYVASPIVGVGISGTAGLTAAPQVQVSVKALTGAGVPGVSVTILNSDNTSGPSTTVPSAYCATGAGANPYAVLTDATGMATCTPILGGVSGTGTISVLVGGDVSSPNYNNLPAGYYQSNNFSLTVAPSTPGTLRLISGNNQSANPGQQFPLPLVAQVGDTAGNPLSGQSVKWTVFPAGAATLSPSSGTSDQNGQVSTTVTLAASAAGQIQVIATVTQNTAITATFTETVNAQLTGLQKVLGDNQSAVVNTTFAVPLKVALSGTNGPVANYPVQFAISGPATLSASSATTDSNGAAVVNVQAGATAGVVTVTATAGSFSVTFTLTVSPPAPSVTSSSFYNGADFQQGALSPCSIATIIATGLAPGIQGVVAPTTLFGPLPYTIASDKVSVGGSQAPLFNVVNENGKEQLTFQVPCDVTPGSSVPVVVTVGAGSKTVNLPIYPASPGVFQTTLSDNQLHAVMIRPDGSFVGIENPARRGEQIVAFVTGLGTTSTSVVTNALPPPGTVSSVLGQVIVGVNNAGAPVLSSQLSPDLIGVYEVTFTVPQNAPQGNNVIFSVAVNPPGSTTTMFSAGTSFPVQ